MEGRSYPDAEYHLIDDAREVVRTLIPKTIHDSVFEGFERAARVTHPETFVASIPKGRFWGHYGGCILSPDDKVLADVSPDVRGIELHPVFRQLKLPRLKELAGSACIVATPEAETTYGHWLLEVVPRFALLKSLQPDFSQADHFVVNYDHSGTQLRLRQQETLALFDIPPEKVIRSTRQLHIRADLLTFPALTTRSIIDITPAVVELIRTAIPAARVHRTGRRIYVPRENASFRRVINEAEVAQCLAQRGFERVHPNSLSLREQAAIFADADAVAGVISSGLSNVVFCRPGAKVIEVFPDNFWTPYEWAVCDAAGLEFYYMFANGISPHPSSDHYARYADVRVDVTSLNLLLDLAEV